VFHCSWLARLAYFSWLPTSILQHIIGQREEEEEEDGDVQALERLHPQVAHGLAEGVTARGDERNTRIISTKLPARARHEEKDLGSKRRVTAYRMRFLSGSTSSKGTFSMPAKV
jgi:hypothetical protein